MNVLSIKRPLLSLTLLFLLCFVFPLPSLTSFARGKAHAASLSSIKTVWLIMFENHSWPDVKGSASAPYINGTLLPQASIATNASDVTGEHPSLTAYLELESGNTLTTTDNPPLQQHFNLPSGFHLTSQLKNNGLSWKTYAEGITGTVCPIKSTSTYGVWHNATVYFDDVTGGNNLNSAYCISHERPFSQLATDLSTGHAPNYSFIEPALGHSMHQPCGTSTDEILCADSWLSQLIPKITASSQYKAGGAIFVSWDEGSDNPDGSDGNGPLGIIVLSPFEKAPGYVDATTLYHHASILRTEEEIFGLPFLGDAANDIDLSNLFA